jgi:hypothetical protein
MRISSKQKVQPGTPPAPQPSQSPPAPPVQQPAPAGEPRDVGAYRLAVGGVSFALVAFLLGGGLIGAFGHPKEMVQEYWTIGAALSGALVGILVPSPRQKQSSPIKAASKKPGWFQPEVFLLIAVIAGSMWLETQVNSADAAQLRTLAAAAAGALVGLLAPSPVKTPPPPGS